LLIAAFGCAHPTAQEVVAAYGRAVEDQNPRAAYGLLSPELRTQLPYEEFARKWSGQRHTLIVHTSSFANAAHEPAQIDAGVRYNDYDTLRMNLTEAGWRISGGVLSVYDQGSPKTALRSFVRALEARNYKVLMRFAPSEYAQHMSPEILKADMEVREAEIDGLILDLKANLDQPIVVQDSRAFLRYAGGKVTFQREGDVWKIEDPD
jgi:hypothetical protein